MHIRSSSRIAARVVGLSLALIGLACSGGRAALPEYAQPRIIGIGDTEQPPVDGVRYRALTRDDFRAQGVPADLVNVSDQLRAFSCVNIRVTFDARIDPRAADGSAAKGYVAEVESLEFYSELDRSCSWWSPRAASVPTEYVLEHEQIHFALFELAARRANRAAPQLRVTGATDREAEQKLGDEIERALASVMERAVDENRRFDEDTSLGYEPDAQKRWKARVERELAATSVPPAR